MKIILVDFGWIQYFGLEFDQTDRCSTLMATEDLHLEDEDSGVGLPTKFITNDAFELSLCLMGRFLTDRQIRAHIMKE